MGQNNANTSFDLNGNMVNDGTNTYQYDAEDRLVQINYPGTGNNTQIFYDGLGHWVKSIETTNNATTSVIQYLWSGDSLIEERDQNSNVLRRFFSLGEQINGVNYYYVKDHLGSIRQMTDSSGNLVYQADYSAYGQATVSINTVTPAFGYAGYFVHGRSGLNLTVHRAYSPSLARFLNRDPIAESGGINLYGYVGGDPVDLSDPLGLDCATDCWLNFSGFGFIGTGLFGASQPTIPKVKDTVSEIKNTSLISKYLKIGKIGFRIPTPMGYFPNITWKASNDIGRIFGRYAPYMGIGITTFSIIDLLNCLEHCPKTPRLPLPFPFGSPQDCTAA